MLASYILMKMMQYKGKILMMEKDDKVVDKVALNRREVVGSSIQWKDLLYLGVQTINSCK